jgi:hypothetical protein
MKRTNRPRYRVEHREHGTIRPLGTIDHAFAHHTALDPFVSALVLAGEGGEVLLVDDATGAVVARRAVLPYQGKPRRRFVKE